MEAYSSQVHGTRHTPVHNLSPADLVCESERGVYGHFHCPFNERNRFQSSSTEEELFFLRDFDRLSPYKSDQEHAFTDHSTGRADTGRVRAVTAPAAQHDSGARPSSPRRPHVPPNDRSAALYYANVVDGHEVALVGSGDDVSRDAEWDKEHWKLSQVVSYQVLEKERENRPRPFHKDYRHYKYFGFAGQGAKTSWAHNPKYTLTSEYRPLETFSKQVHREPMPPLRLHVGGPCRPLTVQERKMMVDFSGHSLDPKQEPSYRSVLKHQHTFSAAR